MARTQFSSLGTVVVGGSGTLSAGEGTAAVSASAAALAADQACDSVLVLCKSTSPEAVFLGSSASRTIELKAGQSIEIEVDNLNDVYTHSAAGTGTYAYLARD